MENIKRVWSAEEKKTSFELINKNISRLNKQLFINDEIQDLDNQLLLLTQDLKKQMSIIKILAKERNQLLMDDFVEKNRSEFELPEQHKA